MNTSFTKEIQKKDIKFKNRIINTEKTNCSDNKEIDKPNNIIHHLNRGKKQYYKKKFPKKMITFEKIAYNNLIKKYNYNNDKYNLLCVNYLLNNAYCHLVSEFKEKMISDYINEFFKREYKLKDIKERIPKFYLYYKHYSIFFGLPFFKNFKFNKLIQKNGEKKARIYYKNHYQNGESKIEENENLGFAQSESGNEGEIDNSNKLIKRTSHIFDSSLKEIIDNVTLMTTINSIENNTINLKLNNEKIEIFSENKTDKSNDTTLGEIVNYINNKDLELKKPKNIKKKNYSLGENINNLLTKDNKKIYINENNKKKLFELINTANYSLNKKIKITSIKKNFIKNQSNNNALTQRNLAHSKNNIIEEKIKKKIISNKNLNSNRIYKKVKLLSFKDDEISNLINTNPIKTTRYSNAIKINKNNIYANSLVNNKYINKIKISKTLKNITDRNIKRNTISNKKDKNKQQKINLIETHNAKEKKKKKIMTRNYIISPLVTKNTYNNNKLHIKHIKNINNTKISLGNLSYQTINYEKGHVHQRTRSNNTENPLIFSKCLITDRYKVYNKPFIRINKKETSKKDDINSEIKASINENYNSLKNQIYSYKSINEVKNKERKNKKINMNNYNKKSNFSKYITDVIKTGNNFKNSKIGNKVTINNNKDLLQIALSLMNNQNNMKKNYNLNININNEININENSNINNSTYTINNLTQRINSKNITNKNVINLKKNKNNNNKETISSYKSKFPFSKKKVNYNSINKKEGKTIRKRNYENNINEALTTINNNVVHSIFFNNSIDSNNKANLKNHKKIKSYHAKSIASLMDLMNHNKKLISLYRNLNKSK